MTTRKTKSKAIKSHPEGYRVFMSGFAEYARENGIHVRGQRGAFAKKASQVWRDLKSKPSWKENLDVILPQYLEGTEGAEKIIIRPEERLKRIAEDLGGNQFEWWNIKSLFGLWIESPDIFPEKDRLFVVDANNKQFEISTDENSFSLYRMFKDEVDGKRIDEYSYVQFEDAEINNKKGIDLIFTVNESTEYRKKIHDKTTYDWDEKIKERYGLQKEAIGEKGVAKLARGKFKVSRIERGESQKPISSLDIQYEKAAAGKLKALNEAITRIESQYTNKLITKAEYKKYLNILYKL